MHVVHELHKIRRSPALKLLKHSSGTRRKWISHAGRQFSNKNILITFDLRSNFHELVTPSVYERNILISFNLRINFHELVTAAIYKRNLLIVFFLNLISYFKDLIIQIK